MRIIQSLWSSGQLNLLQNNFGWYAPEYHIMSWALSCLQLRQYYNDVTLYADTASSKLLIDNLELPYTNVECKLDSLNHYPSQLWALPKIVTYSLQDKPFLHIDGDVFIWKPFSNKLLHSHLIAQNLETATNYYTAMWQNFAGKLTYYPSEIIEDQKQQNPIWAYNAGIFGGTDIDFFKNYTSKAFEFVNRNTSHFDGINVGNFNIFFEQYLFYCMTKQQNKKVSVLIEEAIGDNQYNGFGDFVDVPHDKQYLHLLGNYKRNPVVCEQMAARLRQDYPEYYYKIIELFKNKNVSLSKDYYYFTDTSKDTLLCRNNYLKTAYLKGAINLECTAKHSQLLFNKTNLVTNAAKKLSEQNESATWNYNEHIADVKKLEKDIAYIVSHKFQIINNEYLYGRDLNQTSYFQYVFEKDTFNKKLVADTIFEIVETKFDWTEVENNELASLKIFEQLQSAPSQFYNAVIPECDLCGYSLANIDELDLCIFQILEQPKTIAKLFEEIMPAFDETEINNDPASFEKLILGRVKTNLQHKTLKAIIE